MLSIFLLLALQLPDSMCLRTGRIAADSLAKIHLASTILTGYQARALRTLDSLHAARCRIPNTVPPDTTTPSDTVTPPDTVVPPDSAPPLPSGGVAEAPRAIPLYPMGLQTVSCTDTVRTNLQAALNSARGGQVLCLSGTFVGNYTLPARADGGWVVVTSLVAPRTPGIRIRPSQAGMLSRLVAAGTQPALKTAPKASRWYIRELEITTDSLLTRAATALIDLATPTAISDFATDIVFDRVWAHGWPDQTLRRCVSLQSAATTIMHSWLDDCHEKGADSQAIAGWAGPGPFMIENNHLAGAGENVMFGGADPRFKGVHPSDIIMRRNHLYTPPTWRGKWTKKNILETKNVARLLVEENVFDGSWGDGQTGYAVLIKSANQGATAAHRDNGSRDIIFRRNLIVRASAAISVNGYGADNRMNDSVSRRIEITENYADSIPLFDLDGRGVIFLTGATDILMAQNTWLSPPGKGSAYTGGSPGTNNTTVRMRVIRDLRTYGQYGIMGCWTATCAPSTIWDARLIATRGDTRLPGVALVPTLDAGLSAGYGISRAAIDAVVKGVVVPR